MDQQPLFEIKLELEGKKGVVYDPEIEKSEGGVRSVVDTLNGWINEVFSIAHNFPRLDATIGGPSSGGSTGDYLIESRSSFVVKYSMSRINLNLIKIVKKTQNIKEDLQKYSYLWELHPEENFAKFLEESTPKVEAIVEGEEVEERENILLKECKERIPNLDLFDDKITNLKEILVEVSKI
jgi:dynein heavy chain